MLGFPFHAQIPHFKQIRQTKGCQPAQVLLHLTGLRPNLSLPGLECGLRTAAASCVREGESVELRFEPMNAFTVCEGNQAEKSPFLFLIIIFLGGPRGYL